MNNEMNLDAYWTKDAPYCVWSEDHQDYYKEPPIRVKVAEFPSYIEAVDYCRERVMQNQDESWAWSASYWVTPQPPGIAFNEHKYLEGTKS